MISLDLVSLNLDATSVMQASHWISTRMSLRNGEGLVASRSAAARAETSESGRKNHSQVAQGLEMLECRSI
jgi:hypothetical protein